MELETADIGCVDVKGQWWILALTFNKVGHVDIEMDWWLWV